MIGISCPKIVPFMTAWQHWLGIAKPKIAFRFGYTKLLRVKILIFCYLAEVLQLSN